jgi:hypothetical protein
MAADIPAVKDRVQRYLVDLFGGVQVDRDGDFTLRHGSTQVWVSVKPFHEANTAVQVFAFLNVDVPASPELFRYVATRGSYPFGHLRCFESDGKANVYFQHTLLGEYLDPEELKVAVFFVAGVGDGLDDEIKSQFGGRLFHDEVADGPAG